MITSIKAYSCILIIGTIFISCSPLHSVSNIAYRFDHTPKTTYGNEDVNLWISKTDFSAYCNQQHLCKNKRDSLAVMMLPFNADSFWEPSKKELKPLKTSLKKALRSNRWNNLNNRPGTFWEYSYAFLGVNYGNEKFIEVTALRCDILERCEVITPMMFAFGAGKDFFNATYDVSKKDIDELIFSTQHH
ncbi:MAG: hypothetical protein RIE52_07615 [Balneola sp.]|jgi:hypothetical protein